MAEPVKISRCAVYTRKSSEEGLEQSFNSLHAQREACEAYIVSQKHEGWKLIGTPYDDGGFSGGSMERPGLKALMADITAGFIDTVVVYKVDRLTRSLADFAKMVELFDSHGVSFVSVTQAFNTTTSMGRLTLNVLLSFAQFEREVTGERIRDKIAASKAKGMWMGGSVPLGYDVVDRMLVVNAAEAEHVRTLFRLYLKRRAVDDVVAAAHTMGITSKLRTSVAGSVRGGTKLARGSLYNILGNPIYAGDVAHKGKRFPGQHDAIVEPKLFDAVQSLLESNRRKALGTKTGSGSALLSGLVSGPDGQSLIATYTGKPDRRYRYYAGGDLRLPAEVLDTLVSEAIVEHLASPGKLAALLPDVGLLTQRMIAKAQAIAAAPLDRATIMKLVARVKLGQDMVSVIIRLAAIGAGDGETDITVPATLGRTKARLSLVVPGVVAVNPDPALIAMVAQARAWFEMLAAGKGASLAALATASGVTEAYVRHIIGAAFLAPDLVTRIVEGRQPRALTASRLKTLLPLPSCWAEQRVLFASIN